MLNTDLPDPAEVLGRVARGDRAAFADLYDLYSGHAFAVILRVVSDREVAASALEATFADAWQSAPVAQRSLANPLHWICGLALVHARSRVRVADVELAS